MRLETSGAWSAGSLARGAVPLAIPECPIEQAVRTRDPGVRNALRDQARGRPPRQADAWLVAADEGVRIVARTEGALRPVVAGIVERHGRDVVVSAPRVRYVHRPCLAEPWMRIVATGPAALLPLVLRDLGRRKGRTVRIDDHGGPFALVADAPLANLLGYAEWFEDLCEGRGDVSLRLVRYVTIDLDDGPDAA